MISLHIGKAIVDGAREIDFAEHMKRMKRKPKTSAPPPASPPA
jgi:hypothetical protein